MDPRPDRVTEGKMNSTPIGQWTSRAKNSDCGVHPDNSPSSKCEFLQMQIELEKRDSVLRSLQEELIMKDEEINKWRKKLLAVEIRLNDFEKEKEQFMQQTKSNANALVALNNAELDLRKEQAERLISRCSEMDNLLQTKDDELRAYKDRAASREEHCRQLKEHYQNLDLELQIKTKEVEDSRKQQEAMQLEFSHRTDISNQTWTKYLDEQNDLKEGIISQLGSRIDCQEKELRRETAVVSSLKKQIQQLENTISQLEVDKTNLLKEVNELQYSVAANDKSEQIQHLLRTQVELQQSMNRMQEENLGLLHNKTLLQESRWEVVGLKRQLVDMETDRHLTGPLPASVDQVPYAHMQHDLSPSPITVQSGLNQILQQKYGCDTRHPSSLVRSIGDPSQPMYHEVDGKPYELRVSNGDVLGRLLGTPGDFVPLSSILSKLRLVPVATGKIVPR